MWVNEVSKLKIRKKDYGTSNIIGRKVEYIRKTRGIKQKVFISGLQLLGLDINPTSYSKLEGQTRIASDKEVLAISKMLGITADELFNFEIKTESAESAE